jgi:translation initiation factor eIF-2B subunit delta
VTLGGTEYSAAHQLHPAVLTLGMAYAQGHIRGGNSRAKSMLECFAVVLKDYQLPTSTSTSGGGGYDVRQHLDHYVLKPSFTYWTTMCRPHSVSMGNAFTFLKNAVTALPREHITLEEMVDILVEMIHDYIREHITYAGRAIADFASDKIVTGDVLLTYANPSVLPVLIEMALDQGKDFRVIVVDSRPLLEGKRLLQKLQELNIPCTYIFLHALSYVMPQVTKVVLGASALLSEGSILSRAGTACIALLAHQSGIPVLVCAETYKMSHRTQLDSITNNELGNPNDILRLAPSAAATTSSTTTTGGGGGRHHQHDYYYHQNLRVMNLLYDLTPSHMVSAIVTEVGMLPPTSVAVLLREMKLSESGY